MTTNLDNTSARLICFTDVPNIVTMSESISGNYAQIRLTFNSTLQTTVTATSQYNITILDETIENTMVPQNAVGRFFYIASDNSSTAASVAFALRACSSLNADWNITYNGSVVTMNARQIGGKLNVQNPIATNIPSNYLSTYTSDGTANSGLVGGKVMLGINDGNGTEVTELMKMWHGQRVGFDVSPVLGAMSKYGVATPWSYRSRWMSSQGILSNGSSSPTHYAVIGYLANQSLPYLTYGDHLLINNKREGSEYPLYVYGNTIPISVFTSGSSASVTWTAYDASMTAIASGSEPLTMEGNIGDGLVNIPQGTFNNAYRIDVSFGDETAKFYTAKPLDLSENCTRIFWRGEYGGLMFLDLSAKEGMELTPEVETYSDNIYDFYTNVNVERVKIYKNASTKRITLRSHLIPKEGTYITNSLVRSRRVWTYRGGKLYGVIPIAVEALESDTSNNIYQINITVQFSGYE